MANKKTTPKTATKAATKPAARKKAAQVKGVPAVSSEQLVVDNLSALSSLVGTLSETLDVLVQKSENMAYHLIATEEILAEVVATSGLDLAKVNARIRARIANGTDKQGDPSRAIDIAAAIASPAPRCR